MSEEKGKIRHIVTRIISIFALFIGIANLLCGLLIVLFTYWVIFCALEYFKYDFELIGDGLAYYAYLLFTICLRIAAIGLPLSIVTLFVERNKCLRLLPLIFVLAGCLVPATFACILCLLGCNPFYWKESIIIY